MRLTLVTCTLLAVYAAALPQPAERAASRPSLSFTTKLRGSKFGRIVDADRARIAAHRDRSVKKSGSSKRQGPFSFAVDNQVVTYIASVGVGTPPTTYQLLIDTGSSNTWVGAGTPYVRTSSSVCTGEEFEVFYGSGFVFGDECTDTVTLSPDLVIPNQGIGSANISEGFNNEDGILGIGPTDLTEGTTDEQDEVPTVTDSLFAQGTISTEVVSVFFAPTNQENVVNGELTFGGIDDSKNTSDFTFVPITSTSPANEFWGIDQSISYAGTTIMNLTAGIVDTGTTLIFVPTDTFNTYAAATGGVEDPNTGLLRITTDQFAALDDLVFHIGDGTFALTPNGQIFPRALNTEIGGDADAIYLVVVDTGMQAGSGDDFTDGYTFLERFYTVFDTTNSRFGIATTASTNSTNN